MSTPPALAGWIQASSSVTLPTLFRPLPSTKSILLVSLVSFLILNFIIFFAAFFSIISYFVYVYSKNEEGYKVLGGGWITQTLNKYLST